MKDRQLIMNISFRMDLFWQGKIEMFIGSLNDENMDRYMNVLMILTEQTDILYTPDKTYQYNLS